ncbi:MAG: hypothetical protein KIT72_13880 [Polyangiaceae bacterium]|nr:hypothetical protein [Polyangiaceae bacterium]MCW5791501.1 hypothetical protein [Polyangiaceae bacterium]
MADASPTSPATPNATPRARGWLACRLGALGTSWGPRVGMLLRPAVPVLALAALVHWADRVPAEATQEASRSRALVLALAAAGFEANEAEVHWVDEPGGGLTAATRDVRAVVRAHQADEPADIYLVVTRLSPEGRLLRLADLYNLSDTSAVDERDLQLSGSLAVWRIGSDGKTFSVHTADLAGEDPRETAAWPWLKRTQHRLTNLQKTGQLTGIGKRSFKLEPPGEAVRVAYAPADDSGPGALVVQVGEQRARVVDGAPSEDTPFLTEQPHHLAQPGNLVTWSVDRVRQSAYFSDNQMQFVKAVGFGVLDWVQQVVGSVTGDDGSQTIEEQFKDLPPPVEHTDPETGWPPPPMEPVLSPVLEGEGKWRALDSDPFIQTNQGAPAPFVTSFIRTDRKRAYTQIYVTVWDPRQVALHTMSGTLEPKSATGETGPGLVPRTPEVMGRLLAGFNGGFQASHGEFGMMAEDVVYLPPKPYAATVAELRDGSTGFGTWPNDEAVPAHFVGYRQNMTPLVMDDTINPYKRTWWGGVPPGWKDESRTTRSAVCLTKEHFVAYLYGNSIDADHLALAMKQARCSYGIHLDMNPGHTGLEFYHAAKSDELPDLGRPLEKQWEASGEITGMPGWGFIGRRMLRYMGLMNFPRYISRESRDFFYLTLRHVVPGRPLASQSKEAGLDGAWLTSGLPQHGWPYAIATTGVEVEGKRARVMVLDPRAVRASSKEDAPLVVVFGRKPAKEPPLGLWHVGSAPGGGAFIVSAEAPTQEQGGVLEHEGAELLGRGHGFDRLGQVKSKAGACVGAGGMLYYGEVEADLSGEVLKAAFEDLGCTGAVLFEEPLGVAIGGDRDLKGQAVQRVRGGARLTRRPTPGGKRIFEDTPVVEVKEWYPLQAKRVRYFRKPTPAAEGGAEGAAGGDGSTPAPAPVAE